MKRFAIGRNGVVSNVIAAEAIGDIAVTGDDVFEDVAGTINVGAAYDVNALAFEKSDPAVLRLLLRQQNEIQGLKGQPPVKDLAAFKAMVAPAEELVKG